MRNALLKKALNKPSKLDESALRLLLEDIVGGLGTHLGQRSAYIYGVCGIWMSEATLYRSIKKRVGTIEKRSTGVSEGTNG